jgi:periplasmic copper chaperone A
MSHRRLLRWLLILTTLLLLSACQNNQPAGGLQVRDAWSRPGMAGGNSAVYFVIENQGSEDTLLSAQTDAAAVTELHMTRMNDEGHMSMNMQEKIDIPANENLDFKPGGLHVMLINLNNDLQPGQTIVVRLNFEKAGEVTLDVPIREP